MAQLTVLWMCGSPSHRTMQEAWEYSALTYWEMPGEEIRTRSKCVLRSSRSTSRSPCWSTIESLISASGFLCHRLSPWMFLYTKKLTYESALKSLTFAILTIFKDTSLTTASIKVKNLLWAQMISLATFSLMLNTRTLPGKVTSYLRLRELCVQWQTSPVKSLSQSQITLNFLASILLLIKILNCGCWRSICRQHAPRGNLGSPRCWTIWHRVWPESSKRRLI